MLFIALKNLILIVNLYVRKEIKNQGKILKLLKLRTIKIVFVCARTIINCLKQIYFVILQCRNIHIVHQKNYCKEFWCEKYRDTDQIKNLLKWDMLQIFCVDVDFLSKIWNYDNIILFTFIYFKKLLLINIIYLYILKLLK